VFVSDYINTVINKFPLLIIALKSLKFNAEYGHFKLVIVQLSDIVFRVDVDDFDE
jgi:hypothetical protein